MLSDRIRSQLALLRARLEWEITLPATIAVSSGLPGDGKSAVAFGLAEVLAEAGYRVLLIDANPAHPELVQLDPWSSEATQGPRVAHVDGRFDAITLASANAEDISRDRVGALVSWASEQYAVTVVDTAPIARSNLALLFAAHASTTLLAVRHARRPHADDRTMMAALERIRANVFGLIVTNRDARAQHERARAERTVVRSDASPRVRTWISPVSEPRPSSAR